MTIGGTILQNELSKRLPASFAQSALNGGSADIAYSLIPIIQQLEEPLRTQVRDAFADSIIRVWQTMIGIAGIGLLSSVFMKEVAMHKKVDQDWALKEKQRKAAEAESDSV